MIDFKNSKCHAIARTIDGKVWLWSKWMGSYSQEMQILINIKPQLNKYLKDKYIINICCAYHSLVLTNCGEVCLGVTEFIII